ncbi:DUF4280 domain-containing protein [Flavobacterium columnare NBRC 100251 = ATCC 23463]|uniref:LysM domain-containing protein n=2 Tax=Flavobacterium columnare TaxID=996 RepID=G8X7F0_FLACA|nr:DUF4280 domain-containing protein [Flavobacterium columnare]AEW84964.1 hypothetical protein FCOL_00545 [Flavobacterium columnare ATCC 49512]OOB82691.1 hypothetical protein BZL53_10125 [Flavobacterium columnare]PDS22323.1 DUF4280 domain-containing protein [Flavobacterium columnare NBRC 100251 = ATCC 23463]QOG88563.1 DUF4280 domain-containing protein [Flavobacterium columnare]QOG91223.1 DUF4280 domain-containing protein [Flavobacterium columnare]
MKKYRVQKGDTLNSLAEKFAIKDGAHLRAFHNLYCPLEDLLGAEVVAGKELLIAEESPYIKEKNSPSENPEKTSEVAVSKSSEETTKKETSPSQSSSSSTAHEGKHFVVQKGQCQCNQGFEFPSFKVTSHNKHYWNDSEGESDYLAVTESDIQLNPSAQPFGQCKLKPSSGGYLPCSFAAAGKWSKTYDKVKILDKKCVTEISELMCSTGGKITILKHGQQSQSSKSQVKKANPREQHLYNPIMNFEEFQEEISSKNNEAW